MSDWYTVRFTGRPPEGKQPKVPAGWDENLELGGKLGELFGFEFIDDISLVKEPRPYFGYNAVGPIPKPQLVPNHDFEGESGWVEISDCDSSGWSVLPLKPSWWQRLRKWWKR